MKDYILQSSKIRCAEIYARLLRTLTKDKYYLSPDVTAAKLAQQIDCTPRYISAAVQIATGHNFSALLNTLRLREACRRLASPTYAQRTVEEVGMTCGYRSRQAFYTAFSRHLDCTPLQWRNQARSGKRTDIPSSLKDPTA